MNDLPSSWPHVRTIGFDGIVVSFADSLSEPANRAALAFRGAVEDVSPEGIEESSTSLVSAYFRFNPDKISHEDMRRALEEVLVERDWTTADLPSGRRLWTIPTAFGGKAGPQLEEAAAAAGLSEDAAVASISGQRVRVQTIGFAPGMPYLGELSPGWNIPRQTSLKAQVPAGGLCVAIRQLVLFPVATPTGWRQIGQTALSLFRPYDEPPFLLRPGDEVQFLPVDDEAVVELKSTPDGGAEWEALP